VIAGGLEMRVTAARSAGHEPRVLYLRKELRSSGLSKAVNAKNRGNPFTVTFLAHEHEKNAEMSINRRVSSMYKKDKSD